MGDLNEMMEIAKTHRDKFILIERYDAYALKHLLPSSKSFIKKSGSLESVYNELGISELEIKKAYIEIAKTHLSYFVNDKRVWNRRAAQYNFPSFSKFQALFGSIEKVYEHLPVEKHLLNIAKQYPFYLTDKKSWDHYSSKKLPPLPPSGIMIHFFGSFQTVREKIGMNHQDVKNLLLGTAREHKEKFISKESWDRYIKDTELPSAYVYLNFFDSWTELQYELDLDVGKVKYEQEKEKILNLAKEHKHLLASRTTWDEYARNNPSFPSSTKLYRLFGSLNNLYKELQLSGSEIKHSRLFSDEELLEIITVNKEQFTTKAIWDDFAKNHHLPYSSTFAKRFGSWSDAKEKAGMKETNRRNFSEQELWGIATKYKEHLISKSAWDLKAKTTPEMPTAKTLSKFLGGWNELKLKLGLEKNENQFKEKYTNEFLLETALTHESYFLSSYKWEKYAKENELPNPSVYVHRFTSWENAVRELQEYKSNSAM